MGPTEVQGAIGNLALEQERQRIGQELHDSVAHAFIGILMQASSALGNDIGSAELRSALAKIQSIATEGLMETRGLVLNLRPPTLTSQGLAAALMSLVAKLTSTGKLLCTFIDTTEGQPVPLAIAHCLYRVAQEATQNAFRHSVVTSLNIVLAKSSTAWLLRVEDDAPRTPKRDAWVSRTPAPGESIHERLAAHGGSCRYYRRRRVGYGLVASVPLAA